MIRNDAIIRWRCRGCGRMRFFKEMRRLPAFLRVPTAALMSVMMDLETPEKGHRLYRRPLNAYYCVPCCWARSIALATLGALVASFLAFLVRGRPADRF